MTFRGTIRKMLIDRGMSDNQADEVIGRVIADKANESMKGRWAHDEEDYPSQVILVLWVSVCRHADQFLAETCPHAWFRPVFQLDDHDEKGEG